MNMDAVNEAAAFGENIGAAVCGPANPGEGARCPFRDVCRFQAQKAAVAAADVVIAAHQVLYLPAEIGDFGMAAVDEASWPAAVLEPRKLDIASLVREIELQPVLRADDNGAREADAGATAGLTELCAKLQAAIEATPRNGVLTRRALLDAGIYVLDVNLPLLDGKRLTFRRAPDVRGAIGWELARKVYALRPGMDDLRGSHI